MTRLDNGMTPMKRGRRRCWKCLVIMWLACVSPPCNKKGKKTSWTTTGILVQPPNCSVIHSLAWKPLQSFINICSSMNSDILCTKTPLHLPLLTYYFLCVCWFCPFFPLFFWWLPSSSQLHSALSDCAWLQSFPMCRGQPTIRTYGILYCVVWFFFSLSVFFFSSLRFYSQCSLVAIQIVFCLW